MNLNEIKFDGINFVTPVWSDKRRKHVDKKVPGTCRLFLITLMQMSGFWDTDFAKWKRVSQIPAWAKAWDVATEKMKSFDTNKRIEMTFVFFGFSALWTDEFYWSKRDQVWVENRNSDGNALGLCRIIVEKESRTRDISTWETEKALNAEIGGKPLNEEWLNRISLAREELKIQKAQEAERRAAWAAAEKVKEDERLLASLKDEVVKVSETIATSSKKFNEYQMSGTDVRGDFISYCENDSDDEMTVAKLFRDPSDPDGIKIIVRDFSYLTSTYSPWCMEPTQFPSVEDFYIWVKNPGKE